MSTSNRRSAIAIAVTSALFASSVAMAQQGPQVEEVIVTGSRIARPNLESSVPVTTVSSEELFETGSTSVGDLLNNLPSMRSTFSQSNSQRFLGTTGLNLLDLRGLDTQRTLVLVNGRRHVGSDILSNAVSPDTNTFPTDLIERIDVVTGGNSAVYGSDAIAGVVNFVLKKNFEGLQFRAQGGDSWEGDAPDYYASVLAGTNFMDDRGNIAINLEYAKQDDFFASDRKNLQRDGRFVVTDQDDSGAINGGDGVPDRQYVRDVRFATLANGGSLLVIPDEDSGLAPCGRDYDGRAYGCPLLFQPDGSLVPQTGTRIGTAPGGNFNGGNGSNNREDKLFAIYPELERASLNVVGHLEIAEAFEPFIEAKYVRTDSLQYTGPAFFQGGTIDADREQPRFDNPFLTDAARATITAAYLAGGLAAPAADEPIALRRNLADLGPRQEDATRETSRIVLGVGGDFADDWNYEVAVNYGRFKEDTVVLGNLNQQRFVLAMDSTRDANGNIVCRSQIDPAAALIYPFAADEDFANAQLAGDVAACVPLNPFGEGSITPAMRNYLLTNTTSVAEITQFVASASVSGTSRNWFELPAGPIGMALGFEHRTEENEFRAEDIVESSLTFYNALPRFEPPKFKVNEAFAELRVPLLSGMTMAEELTINAAGRFADYDGATGEVFAHNYGLDWAPIDSLRFRVGMARAVRAPNLVDLYSDQSQNFAFVDDPCASQNIGAGSPTRAANCAAAGIPASFDYEYTATLEIISGGNPDLREETSDSFTAGVVFQPSFLSGFTLSVDYFDIDIEDVITAPTAQDIINACYDSASTSNQFCALFQRNSGPGFGPKNEEPYQILEGTLEQISLNYAKSTARGIDVEASYATEVGSFGQLGTRLVYTRTLQRDDFLDPVNPNDADQLLWELGDPRDAFNFSADLRRGAFSFGYEMRYIGKMVLNFAEDTYSVNGNPPQDVDYGSRRYYPNVFYHDVRAAFDVNDSLNVYLGVDNVEDKTPPFGLTGAGEGSGIYETRGRFVYGGLRYAF
jgi:outer membrane receptor protein involved in Fe transport